MQCSARLEAPPASTQSTGRRSHMKARTGFTLIELLVVIAII
ncbi:MAG: type II secretion system protein [Firmicutes bacterium]|nr:type II secretion system protein [Bacillota bacterium]